MIAREQSGDIFEKHEGRTQPSNNSHCFVEQSRARALEARPLARNREVLARESTANDVDFAMGRKLLRANRANIFIYRRFRKLLAQHRARPSVYFNTPRDAEARVPKAQVDPPNARKQRTHSKRG
jgi:hypothetical protein